MNPHAALGIAQIVFYIPAVPLAIWLMIRNGKLHPRMAWYPLIPFTLMRLAGGPLVIALEKNGTDVGLATATIVLLNVGVVPLVIAASGLLRLIIMDNYELTVRTKALHKILRLATILAIILLAGGGSLSGQADSNLRSIGRSLLIAGYGIFAVELLAVTGGAAYFWFRRGALLSSSCKAAGGILIASPFLMVRTAYGLLQVILQTDLQSKWNPVYGSAVAFALMALLVEYIAMGTFFAVGFSIPPHRGLPRHEQSDPGAGKDENGEQPI